MLKAVIYARISQDRAGEGIGVLQQQEDGVKMAELRGWQVVAVKIDNDISAAGHKKRPAFDEALAMLAAGEVDVIIAWDFTRLTRNRRDQLRLIEVCERRGAIVALVRGSDIDLGTPAGRLVADMLASVARHEIDQKSDRIRRARERDALAGRWHGGVRPFGFQADGVTIEPGEAAEIVKATESLLAGDSLRSAVRAINATGITTSRGNEWNTVELRQMLMRPRNAGLAVHAGKVVGAASWPAIVSEDHWRGVVALLSDPGRKTSPGNRARWLGSGLYVCGLCGQTMICSRSGGQRSPAYRCRPPRGGSQVPGKHVVRTAAPLDEFVGELIIERLSRPDAVDLLKSGHSEDVATLHLDALALRERLDEQAALHADGVIDTRQLVKGSERIRARLAEVEAKIAAAGQGSVFAGVAGVENPREVWERLELGRKRAILDALFTVTILPAQHGRGPDGSYFDPSTVQVDPKR